MHPYPRRRNVVLNSLNQRHRHLKFSSARQSAPLRFSIRVKRNGYLRFSNRVKRNGRLKFNRRRVKCNVLHRLPRSHKQDTRAMTKRKRRMKRIPKHLS